MLLARLEGRDDQPSAVVGTQYAREDWCQRHGAGVHAEAIIDRIVHGTTWVETGGRNVSEHTAAQGNA